MMADGLDREASLEHRAARWLNTTMVSLLLLGGIAFGLGAFLISLPTIKDILAGLSATQQNALFLAAIGPMVALTCLSYLVPIIRKAFNRRD